MSETTNRLAEAVSFLAARCDGAITEDGQGFNGTDTGFGKYMATVPADQWTDEQTRAVYDTVGKYRGQLASGGIDFAAIAEPAQVDGDARQAAQEQRREANRQARAAASKTLTHDDTRDEFVLGFAYDAELVEAARSLPRRRYNGQDKTNRTPRTAEAAVALLAFTERYGPFTIDPVTKVDLDRLAADADTSDIAEAAASARLELEDGRAVAFFDYSRERIAAAKAAGGRFDRERTNGGKSCWTFALTAATGAKLADFIRELPEDAAISDELSAHLDSLVTEAEERREASRAEDSDLHIDGLGAELRPFQRAGVAYALRARRTFIGDDMGTGKTVQALAALKADDAFPAIVVAPNPVKLTWVEHVHGGMSVPYAPEGWLPGRRAVALYGQKPDAEALRGADVIVINWDILSKWLDVLTAVNAKALILDECHMAKNSKAARTKAAKALAKGVIRDKGMVLNLSGTPLLNRPIELAAQLEILGRLDDFGGFFGFAKRYAGAYRNRYGWDFSGATNLEELASRLRESCFIRRTKEQVLPELPPKVIAHQHIELDNRAEYLRVEADLIGYLRDEAARNAEFDAELEGLSEEQVKAAKAARANDAEFKAKQAEHLVQINALRRVIAKGKLAGTVEWIKNFLDSTDEKLVVMAYHVDELQKPIREALADYNPAVIAGGVGADEQKRNETKFQTDPTCRVIVCSLKAAGVGLTLTAASNMAICELDWTPNSLTQAEDRCHRIGSEGHESVTAWYLLGKLPRSEEPTIDDEMRALLDAKLAVTSTVTDGTARKVEVSILNELTERLVRRAESRQGSLA